jgi:hypothetical protein
VKIIAVLLLTAGLTATSRPDAFARREQIIYNPVEFLPPTVQGLPQDRIEALIVQAGSEHGWMFRHITPGHLEATYTRKKYVAVVDIIFDNTSWRITYQTSDGLGAEGGDIHPTYNRWVRKLETDINARLGAAQR